MEAVTMNKKEVLSEANKLVGSGLRKAAIALLLEYLEDDNGSVRVHAALGRAYLVDKQPARAVFYLKRSLELKQAGSDAGVTRSTYGADSFDDDDMAFVESQGGQSEEQVYTAETDDLGPRYRPWSGARTPSKREFPERSSSKNPSQHRTALRQAKVPAGVTAPTTKPSTNPSRRSRNIRMPNPLPRRYWAQQWTVPTAKTAMSIPTPAGTMMTLNS